MYKGPPLTLPMIVDKRQRQQRSCQCANIYPNFVCRRSVDLRWSASYRVWALQWTWAILLSSNTFVYVSFLRIGNHKIVFPFHIGGGRVTRFPFGPFNVFAYISHCALVNSQNRPDFQGDYRNWWLTRALLDAIQMAASRSNMITYLCKIGTWCY